MRCRLRRLYSITRQQCLEVDEDRFQLLGVTASCDGERRGEATSEGGSDTGALLQQPCLAVRSRSPIYSVRHTKVPRSMKKIPYYGVGRYVVGDGSQTRPKGTNHMSSAWS